MAVVVPRRPGVRFALILPLLLLVAAAWAWRREKRQEHIDLSKNYEVAYTLPAGWKVGVHGPETKFRLIDPKTDLVLRGEVNQVIDENNPTPDLDTKGIANYYLQRTQENMPEWKAEDLGTVAGDGTDFELIRRSTKKKVVVSAFASKGNTTVIVTLFGQQKAAGMVDSHMDYLSSFLKTVSLHEKDMSNL
jgi:hypothetical protein